MSDTGYVYATAITIACFFIWRLARRRFDPFEPIWMFLTGYAHLYVVQPLSVREWALTIRGLDVVTMANQRAFWALLWFLFIYQLIPLKRVARLVPCPPERWSSGLVWGVSPVLIAWGLVCAYYVIRQSMGIGDDPNAVSAEETLFRSFPFLLMVAGILLIVTGRQASTPSGTTLTLGLLIASLYVFVWMFNGKRSHSLIGVLATVCAFYVSREKRPSWPVLISTALCGMMVVALSIGWRNNYNYERSARGFIHYVGDFQFTSILASLNVTDGEEEVDTTKLKSYETIEFGGFLLMLDTVPEKTDHDYGASYLRCFSTFIPRIVWPDKPLFGREQWIKAWQAGSELKRDDEFTGPAIGILGATHLNGGAAATLIVLGVLAGLMRIGYEYFSAYSHVPWIQAWWSLTYFNAWFSVVGDDPLTWFYYNYGFTCGPVLVLLFLGNRLAGAAQRHPLAVAAA
jgi:hypothetical protein